MHLHTIIHNLFIVNYQMGFIDVSWHSEGHYWCWGFWPAFGLLYIKAMFMSHFNIFKRSKHLNFTLDANYGCIYHLILRTFTSFYSYVFRNQVRTVEFDLTLSDFELWSLSWPWPSNFKAKLQNSHLSRMVVCLTWNKMDMNRYCVGSTLWTRRVSPLMTLTLDFQGQILK